MVKIHTEFQSKLLALWCSGSPQIGGQNILFSARSGLGCSVPVADKYLKSAAVLVVTIVMVSLDRKDNDPT